LKKHEKLTLKNYRGSGFRQTQEGMDGFFTHGKFQCSTGGASYYRGGCGRARTIDPQPDIVIFNIF